MSQNKKKNFYRISEIYLFVFCLIGYYRVNYDKENWRKIISYLKTDDYEQIHVLNRAKLIDDAFYFMMNRTLPSSIFWDLTAYLYRDTDYIAWYPMFKAMGDISQIIPFSDNNTTIIKVINT